LEDLIREIERYTIEIMENKRLRDESHDSGHAFRVRKNALDIAPNGIDRITLEICCLFHDLGRAHIDKETPHAQLSVQYALPLLEHLKVSNIDIILNAIGRHSFLNADDDDIYTIVLKDADRLDALGVMGTYRILQSHHTQEEVIKDFKKVLEFIDMLRTPNSKKLALPKQMFSELFLMKFLKERSP